MQKNSTCSTLSTHVRDVVLPHGREVGDLDEALDDLLLGRHLLGELLGDDVPVHSRLLLQEPLRAPPLLVELRVEVGDALLQALLQDLVVL